MQARAPIGGDAAARLVAVPAHAATGGQIHGRLRLVALLLASACAPQSLPDADGYLCGETAVAVAQQVLTCTGDSDRANVRHDDFFGQYDCPGAVSDQAFACAQAIRRAPCSALTSASFEHLVRRDAPVCNRLVQLAGGSNARPLPPGEAHASGLFNGVVTHFDCVFGSANLTSAGPGLGQVVGSSHCGGGQADTFGFLLVLSSLMPQGTYTSPDAAGPTLQELTFPNFTGDDDGTLQAYNLTMERAYLDPDGYLQARGTFQIAKKGLHLQYDLSGTFDLVLQP